MAFGDNMNPSTFQQVRENMREILQHVQESDEKFEQLDEDLGQIQTTLDDLTKPEPEPDPGEPVDPSQVSDTTVDANGRLQVLGVTLQVNQASVNTMPPAYIRDVTFELKSPSAIGLNGVDGFEADYVLAVTLKRNPYAGSAGDFPYRAQQIVYGANMVSRTRTADEDNTNWGEWNTPSGGGTSGGGGSVSPVEPDPDAQNEGDFWFEPIPDEELGGDD